MTIIQAKNIYLKSSILKFCTLLYSAASEHKMMNTTKLNIHFYDKIIVKRV